VNIGLVNAACYSLVREHGAAIAARPDFQALLGERVNLFLRAGFTPSMSDDELRRALGGGDGLGELGGWFSDLFNNVVTQPSLWLFNNLVTGPARASANAVGWNRGAHYIDIYQNWEDRNIRVGTSPAVVLAVVQGFATGGPWGAIIGAVVASIGEYAKMAARHKMNQAAANAAQAEIDYFNSLTEQQRTLTCQIVALDLGARRGLDANSDAGKAALDAYLHELETQWTTGVQPVETASKIIAREIVAAGYTGDEASLAANIRAQLESGKSATQISLPAGVAPPPAAGDPAAPAAGASPDWMKLALAAAAAYFVLT
jgi:hypothetical protein